MEGGHWIHFSHGGRGTEKRKKMGQLLYLKDVVSLLTGRRLPGGIVLRISKYMLILPFSVPPCLRG